MRRGSERDGDRGDAEREAVRRAEALVERVLAGVPAVAPVRRSPLDLDESLAAMEGELRLLAAGGGAGEEALGPEVVLALAGLLPPIRVERAHLRELARHLVANAVEALAARGPSRRRGRIVLATRGVGDARGTALEHVALSVRDDGPGMDAETLARAFDPFFTTKAAHSGLGLSVVRKIASACGARVSVASSPGRGSVFTILFPVRRDDDGARRAGRPRSESSARPAPAPDRGTARGTLLVVDDDAGFRVARAEVAAVLLDL